MDETLKLLEFVKMGKKQIWIGYHPPFDMVAVNLLNSSGFRLSSSHHHQYDIVWFYESLLDDVGELHWKIVTDELIRLINGSGKLIVRMRKNHVPSYDLFKHFLGRHIGILANVEYEQYNKETDIWTAVFEITRLHMERYCKTDWTFSVLTMGQKVENVTRFLKSIRDYELGEKSEIIIVGPPDEKYDAYHVRYIDLSQFRDEKYAEIGKKKNAIIEAASNTNLMIAHDRFALSPNFFSGFEKYGYDFDFVTVPQFLEDGTEIPCYAVLKETMRSSELMWVREYRNLYENQYINGGLLIMKTHIAKEVMFNRMLMWDQKEDVELSKTFIERGIIPRVNFISEALALGFRGNLSIFKPEPAPKATIPVTPKSVEMVTVGKQPFFYKAIKRITSRVPSWLKNSKIYQRAKQIYWGK